MKDSPPERPVDWPPLALFVVFAISLSSAWACYVKARGWLTNPQNAGFAASVAQLGVLVSALVTMSLFARGSFKKIGWRPGPWTAYARIFVVMMALVACMAIPMVLGFQRLKGGTEVPSDVGWMAIPFLLAFSSLFAFAEEIGWRGFLLPGLWPLGTRSALLWSGVIWFCWEAPLVYFGLLDSSLIGINLPLALACHFLSTVAIAVVFGYLRLRFDSVFLPTFAHGLLNALGGLSFLFVREMNPVWSDFGGPVGTALTVVVAVFVWRQVGRDLEEGPLPGPAATQFSPRTAPGEIRG